MEYIKQEEFAECSHKLTVKSEMRAEFFEEIVERLSGVRWLLLRGKCRCLRESHSGGELIRVAANLLRRQEELELMEARTTGSVLVGAVPNFAQAVWRGSFMARVVICMIIGAWYFAIDLCVLGVKAFLLCLVFS